MNPNASRGPKPWKNPCSVRAIVLASGFLRLHKKSLLKMCDFEPIAERRTQRKQDKHRILISAFSIWSPWIFLRQEADGNQLAAIASLVVKGTVKVNVETVLPLAEAAKRRS